MEIIDNIYIQQRKDKIVAKLQNVVDTRKLQNDYLKESLIFEKEIISNLNDLVKQEVPEFQEAFAKITGIYSEAVAEDSNFLSQKVRSVEDINDIQERFTVVVRQNQKYQDAKENLKEATQAYDRAKLRYDQELSKNGPNLSKLSVKVAECSTAWKNAIEQLKTETLLFIEQKKKFNAFRARRIKSSYKTLGTATKESTNAMATLYENMKNSISEAKENVDTILSSKRYSE
jgi:hypothetical protein